MSAIKTAGRRLVHWMMALSLLPFLIAAVHQLILLLPQLGQEGWQSWWIYLAGMGFYGIIELVFHKPMWIYVFGHELTHALSGILSGAKILRFRATPQGGEVQLSKSNIFILLSPYVVPIYMVMVLGTYACLRIWFQNPELNYGFQFLMGVTLAFHLSLTFMAIHRHQPDLKILGYFLSSTLIWLGNALILGILCLSLFKKTPTFSQYGQALWSETLIIWKMAWAYGTKGTEFLYLWTHLHIH